MTRKIRATDLELYTVNTGAFYETHKLMARHHFGLDVWRDHLRDRVISLYSREIEPVYADFDTLQSVAVSLKDYYERHVQELDR